MGLNSVELNLSRPFGTRGPAVSDFDKLDVMFTAFIHFALIVEALR